MNSGGRKASSKIWRRRCVFVSQTVSLKGLVRVRSGRRRVLGASGSKGILLGKILYPREVWAHNAEADKEKETLTEYLLSFE